MPPPTHLPHPPGTQPPARLLNRRATLRPAPTLPSLSLYLRCARSYSPPGVLKVDMPAAAARPRVAGPGQSVQPILCGTRCQARPTWAAAAPRPEHAPDEADSPLPENTTMFSAAAARSIRRCRLTSLSSLHKQSTGKVGTGLLPPPPAAAVRRTVWGGPGGAGRLLLPARDPRARQGGAAGCRGARRAARLSLGLHKLAALALAPAQGLVLRHCLLEPLWAPQVACTRIE